MRNFHCAKSVRIRSFSGLYFLIFELNTEIYSVNLGIQSECQEMRTRKTKNMDTFLTVFSFWISVEMSYFYFSVFSVCSCFSKSCPTLMELPRPSKAKIHYCKYYCAQHIFIVTDNKTHLYKKKLGKGSRLYQLKINVL